MIENYMPHTSWQTFYLHFPKLYQVLFATFRALSAFISSLHIIYDIKLARICIDYCVLWQLENSVINRC